MWDSATWSTSKHLHCGALLVSVLRTHAQACGPRQAEGAEIWSAPPGKSAHAHKPRLHGLQRLRRQRTRGPTGPGAAASPTCCRPAPAASQEENKPDKQSCHRQVHHGGHHDVDFQVEPARHPETRDLPGPAHRSCGPSYFLSRPRPPLGPALASLNGEVLIFFRNQSAAQ